MMSSTLQNWIEASRPRTLPVSVAGVGAGCAIAIILGSFRWLPALLCLLFALLAQIASNFANEYFDFHNGLDRRGREGFRRGVTEGDIAPKAMLRATLFTLALACIVGCGLIFYGGWLMIPIGFVIALTALAYSAGPYPLSHNGLGDIAVIMFFGLVPVCLTAWLQIPESSTIAAALPTSIGIGLLINNVLIVNNYRDADDDRAVGKRTTVVIFGRRRMALVYLLNVIIGTPLAWYPILARHISTMLTVAAALICLAGIIRGHSLFRRLLAGQGAALNSLLKQTAMLSLFTTILLLASAIVYSYINIS